MLHFAKWNLKKKVIFPNEILNEKKKLIIQKENHTNKNWLVNYCWKFQINVKSINACKVIRNMIRKRAETIKSNR